MHLSSYEEMVGLPKDTAILIMQLQWEVGVGGSRAASSPLLQHLLTELSSPSVLATLDSLWLQGTVPSLCLLSITHAMCLPGWFLSLPLPAVNASIFPLQPGYNIHQDGCPMLSRQILCLSSLWHQGPPPLPKTPAA